MAQATDPRDRARLARVLADFWAGGSGPSHGELGDAFAVAGVDPDGGCKRDRVSTAVRSVLDRDLFTLLDQLIELLQHWVLPEADEAVLARLRQALKPFGFSLGDDFKLTSIVRPDVAHVSDEPAVREHIERIQRALRDGDDAQILGSSKELLESAAKLVLEATRQAAPLKFPALLTAALEVLQIHPKVAPSCGTPVEEPVRKILGGVVQIALGVNDLRATHGTGHGGTAPRAKLGDRQVRLAASSAVTVAAFMLDTLDDPGALAQAARINGNDVISSSQQAATSKLRSARRVATDDKSMCLLAGRSQGRAQSVARPFGVEGQQG